ncbi:hypothetical protein C8R43DRAFT_868767, partial [Mycena crocata]
VGIAAQLPSGPLSAEDLDYASFWDFLVKGEKAYQPLVSILPDSFKDNGEVKLPSLGAFLKNAMSFDNISFGISARDARVMPYSARRLVDLSFQALLDSGLDSRGRDIGCFMSGNRGLQAQDAMDADGSFSWMPYSMANRISYALDLTGPSVSLDTACSSSLTALHVAIAAIERGDCSAALVGAAQINRDPFEWKTYAQGGVLSPDGTTKPFDDAADGFGRGEGAVVVVLKPLKDALRDNDHIYSVVVGSAINATGSHMPLNVPNGVAQEKCINEAYRRAGLDPRDADYIELHATGTSVGDPIETNAAGRIFATDVSATFGTVKGNLGHLEVAAFLASLVKACLIFEHGIIPPTVNFLCPSGAIEWDSFKVVVPVVPTALGCRATSGRPTISLSGSGLGGATGHVVLQGSPGRTQIITSSSTTPILFLVGGLSSKVVDQISQNVLQMDANDATLVKSAVTLSRRARQLHWRTYFTLPLAPRAVIAPPTLVPNSPPLAFVFSGQGPQHLEMGRQLFAAYPSFRNCILELDAVYRRVRGVSLMESTGLFFPVQPQCSPPTVTLPEFGWPVIITVSAIAMVQIAMVDLLKSIGVVPDVMLGHSAGETAILYASGAGSKEMAMEIAIARGEAMTCTEGPEVGMAMLACDAKHASELIERVTAQADGILEISCFNTPVSVTVSGTGPLLDEIVVLAKNEGLFAQRLRTLVPGHSSFMDCIQKDYLARMDDIFARYPGSHKPRIPVFSTCRKDVLVDEFTAKYFWDNCRNAVLFSKAVFNSIPSSPVFIEISCHPVLSSSIIACGVPDDRVVCPMRRISAKAMASLTESGIFLDTLGRLSLLGVNSLDLSGLYGFSAFKSKLIDHPLVARAISPPKSSSPRLLRSALSETGPLSSANLRMNKTTHPDLAEHIINGEPILPATGFIELLLEAGANFLWDVEFMSILSLASASPLEISVQKLESSWSVTTSLGSREREHARGFMDKSSPNDPPPVMDFTEILERLPALNFDDFYSAIQPLANYGPRFRRVVRCHGGPAEVLAEISGPTLEELAAGYLLHPAMLDACLHVMLHVGISKQYSKDVMYLPSRLEHFVFYRRVYGAGNWYSHIRLRQWTPDARYYDILVTDSTGFPLCEIRSLVVKKFTSTPPITIQRRFDLVFQPVAVNVAIPPLAASFSKRADEAQIQLLYTTLDSLALEMLSKSLSQDIVLTLNQTSTPNRNRLQLAVDALYSDGLMAQFYSQTNQTSNVCLEATEAFSAALETLRQSGKKTIRILEVGAGTGLLTYHLIDELKRNPDLLLEYTLVANLARSISYGSIIPKAYDIGKDPDTQGIRRESYDIVVSLHVLHTAPNVKDCLASLQHLLVPGGCLLTVELDGTGWTENPGSVWFDCIFGSFPEWFGYADGRSDHCAIAPAIWKEQLEAVNFVNVQTCVEHGGSGRDFFFIAQKSFASVTVPLTDPLIVYSYEFGQEIRLQSQLGTLDTAAPLTIHVLALAGRDADAAAGLCVTLRKEIPRWDIRLCIFDSLVDVVNPIPLLSRHASIFSSGENLIFFDGDGSAHVSRVALSAPPSFPPDTATETIHWDDPSHVTVRVIHWAGMHAVYDGFVGQLEQSHQSDIWAGPYVGGVARRVSSKTLRVPVDSIVSVAENPDVDLARNILAALLTSLVPTNAFADIHLAFALEDSDLAKILHQRISSIPRIRLLVEDFTDPRLYQRVDTLFTDSFTYTKYPHLRRWIPRSGQVILWDDQLRDKITQDPAHIGRTLTHIFHTGDDIATFQQRAVTPPTPSSLCSNNERQLSFRASPPFRADRAYVLLGGIGGLGVDLAVWMYQHGARHLLLTSRRGVKSLDPVEDAITLAKVRYLKNRPELSLSLEACDATHLDDMTSLLHSLPVPVAGCLHMTLVLSDAPFFKQTTSSFNSVYDSKLKVFDIFASIIPIESLDFFVALSSISGVVGLGGQANYAAACTSLDGVLARYHNAFSLITPGISDAGYLAKGRLDQVDFFKLTGCGIALWACLEDGLRKLESAPFNQYIPDVDWNSLDANFTLPGPCRHLVSFNRKRSARSTLEQVNESDIRTRVLELLEVSTSDFDATQPLTIYGLDSISAAKLSSLLRPYGSFSQMHLLGGATWSDVEKEVQSFPTHVADIMQLMGQTTWSELLQLVELPLPDPVAQPLVEICSGSGTPLIILPGGNGSMALFFGLRKHYRGALWAIQVTNSTPLESLNELVAFWKQHICEKRPHGPYRFAAYSASTLLSVALTKLFEDAGEEVSELIFIDHCPALWTREESEAILRERTVAEFRDLSDESVLDMLKNDPSIGSEAYENYQAALRGMPHAPLSSRTEVNTTRKIMSLIFQFLQGFYPTTSPRSYHTFIGPFKTWLFSIKAPLAVLIAEHGIVHSAPGGAWPDLGATCFAAAVKVHYINGVGHYGLFRDEVLARILSI